MKISHIESKEVKQEIIDDIVCNKCGNSCYNKVIGIHDGIIEITLCGGYASKLGDMVEYTFSICESCLLEMFDEFKIKPTIKDLM